MAFRRKRRRRRGDLAVMRWPPYERFLSIFPRAVSRKRLAAPRLVFILGISLPLGFGPYSLPSGGGRFLAGPSNIVMCLPSRLGGFSTTA